MSEIKIIASQNWVKENVKPKYQQPEWGVEFVQGVVLSEATYTIPTDDPTAAITTSFSLAAGKEYTVNYNGTAYTCTAVDVEGMCFIGNLLATGMEGAEDTGEPFAIISVPAEQVAEMGFYGILVALDGVEAVTLSVEGPTETVHNIPAKYVENAPVAPLIANVSVDGTTGVVDTDYSTMLAAIKNGRNVYLSISDDLYSLAGKHDDVLHFMYINHTGDTTLSIYIASFDVNNNIGTTWFEVFKNTSTT